MATKNAIGSEYSNNTDGWHMIGGTTNKRKLTVTGADITMTGGGTAVHTFPAATDNIMGESNNLASQSDQETATSTTKYVSPGKQHNHPSAAKFWAMATVASNVPTLQVSFNVTSITDTNTGQLTITIATDFSSANWCCQVSVEKATTALTTADARLPFVRSGGQAAGTILAGCTDSVSTTTAVKDPGVWHVAGYGDQ
jgi:hypothetical protein